jgi:RNA recognition motif-containing protein
MVDETQKPEIRVVNLSDEVTEETLKEYFQSCGEIQQVRIMTKFSPYCAFITFLSLEEAQKALE